MIALTAPKTSFTHQSSLYSDLYFFQRPVESESVHIQRHFQACFFSHMDDGNVDILSSIQSWFQLTLHDVYILYMLNTNYFTVKWQERVHWIEEAAEFIILHRNELLTLFVVDLYTYLIAQDIINEFQNPKPNYLAVASILVSNNSDVFCQAIRLSMFGEEAFKSGLNLFIKRGTMVDYRVFCIDVYASFGALTSEFVDMVFALCLDDFSVMNSAAHSHWEKIRTADRGSIENIFLYLESVSMNQRRLALRWLVRLVELDILSIYEVQEVLHGKDIVTLDNRNNECNETTVWDNLLCLEPLHDRKSFDVLTSEEVEADFLAMLEVSYLQCT